MEWKGEGDKMKSLGSEHLFSRYTTKIGEREIVLEALWGITASSPQNRSVFIGWKWRLCGLRAVYSKQEDYRTEVSMNAPLRWAELVVRMDLQKTIKQCQNTITDCIIDQRLLNKVSP